eukprot:m.81056 g.81056  ORF g.81056 m.81056 type:complete len:329 (-) comp8068_c0_seq3:2070-3056(-)
MAAADVLLANGEQKRERNIIKKAPKKIKYILDILLASPAYVCAGEHAGVPAQRPHPPAGAAAVAGHQRDLVPGIERQLVLRLASKAVLRNHSRADALDATAGKVASPGRKAQSRLDEREVRLQRVLQKVLHQLRHRIKELGHPKSIFFVQHVDLEVPHDVVVLEDERILASAHLALAHAERAVVSMQQQPARLVLVHQAHKPVLGLVGRRRRVRHDRRPPRRGPGWRLLGDVQVNVVMQGGLRLRGLCGRIHVDIVVVVCVARGGGARADHRRDHGVLIAPSESGRRAGRNLHRGPCRGHCLGARHLRGRLAGRARDLWADKDGGESA